MRPSGAARPRPWPGPRPGLTRPSPAPAGPRVDVTDEQGSVAVDIGHLGDLARAVLLDQDVARGELALTFVDEETIAVLNRRHLDGDGPTDVLAFPLDVDGEADPVHREMPVLLGDVVVCPSVAERNAAERQVSIEDELALLVVHGVLHVLGLDHAEPDEAGTMQARERALLAAHHHRP